MLPSPKSPTMSDNLIVLMMPGNAGGEGGYGTIALVKETLTTHRVGIDGNEIDKI